MIDTSYTSHRCSADIAELLRLADTLGVSVAAKGGLTPPPGGATIKVEAQVTFNPDTNISAEVIEAVSEVLNYAEAPPLEVLDALASIAVRVAVAAAAEPNDALDWFIRRIDEELDILEEEGI